MAPVNIGMGPSVLTVLLTLMQIQTMRDVQRVLRVSFLYQDPPVVQHVLLANIGMPLPVHVQHVTRVISVPGMAHAKVVAPGTTKIRLVNPPAANVRVQIIQPGPPTKAVTVVRRPVNIHQTTKAV